jgi:branched-chain amino acid transport system permease protein
MDRTLRALRNMRSRRAHGVSIARYKALAFGFAGFGAGVSGAISARLYTYLNNHTFDSQLSLLAVMMAIRGGMGNILGAILGALAPVGSPEAFRFAAECRILIYGLVLLAHVRIRPQGLLGTA